MSTRERLLRVAAAAFAEKGYKATTIRYICSKARANVASVSYHFGSKEDLYVETFRFLYDETGMVDLKDKQLEVTCQEDWENAVYNWGEEFLEAITSNTEKQRWRSKLFARERLEPSKELPVILERMMRPIQEQLNRLLRMALPENVTDDELKIWSISTVSQCTMYAERDEPWDKLLLPENMSQKEWLKATARHVTESVTCRLSFQG